MTRVRIESISRFEGENPEYTEAMRVYEERRLEWQRQMSERTERYNTAILEREETIQLLKEEQETETPSGVPEKPARPDPLEEPQRPDIQADQTQLRIRFTTMPSDGRVFEAYAPEGSSEEAVLDAMREALTEATPAAPVAEGSEFDL